LPSFRKGWTAVAFFLLAQMALGEVSPLSLSLYGVYGTPVQPLSLAANTTNGFGFELLGEWNASTYASLGLSFEQVSFSEPANFSIPVFNLEGRLFPFESGRYKFSPYVYGGAGLNLSKTGGATQLKTGIGSRVSLMGPLFFDVAVGSHWIQAPNPFQFVDLRAGLSCSIEFNEKPQQASNPAANPAPAKPAAAPATVSPSPTVQITPAMIPSPSPTVQISPEIITLDENAPTPTPVIDAAPVTTLAQGKFYYKIGNDAFAAGNYPLALKAYKKSLTLKEKHKAAYYYAETYAQLGVIYQFHAMKVKDHDKKALDNYKKALKIDPGTKSAKRYYKKLKTKVAKEAAIAKKKAKAKPKKKNKPAPAESATTTSPDATPANP